MGVLAGDGAQQPGVGARGRLVRRDDQPTGIRHVAAHLAEPLVGGGQHRGHPLALGVERGAPGLGGLVLGERLAEPGGHLVAGLGAPAHRAAVGEEEHRAHDAVAQRRGVAVGVVGRRAQDAVLAHLVAHERDGGGVRAERRAGERQPPGGAVEGLADAVAPRPRVAAVVDLVEDDQGRRLLGAAAVQLRLRGDRGVGQGHPVVLVRLQAAGVGERRVELDADPAGGVGPLVLEVLGGGDHGDGPDDAAVEQLGRDPQGVGGLAGAGGGHGEEVALPAAEVGLEGLLLPRAQLRGGTPRRPLGEGGWQVSGG